MSFSNRGSTSCLMLYVSFLVLTIGLLTLSYGPLVEAKKDKGDDIILSKGKIILRGGKGKGNIILDPGHSGGDSHHEMPHMMPMMSHFNPYAFYPMQHHHQPQVMIRPIYIEDHSSMHHVPMVHHEPQHHHEQHQHEDHHHEHQEYHHEEPQHHYEPQHQHHEVEQHHEQHHEQPHYEHSHEGAEEHHHDGGYEHGGHHGGHPLMSLMAMHGSGPQPIYQQQQQLATMQAIQQPAMYAQLVPGQQAAAYQQAQYLAAEQEAAYRQQQQQQHNSPQQETQQGQSSEIASQSPSDASANSSGPSSAQAASSSAPSKPVNKVTALLEKSASNSKLVQIIKPLFKRNKDQKDSSQKKP